MTATFCRYPALCDCVRCTRETIEAIRQQEKLDQAKEELRKCYTPIELPPSPLPRVTLREWYAGLAMQELMRAHLGRHGGLVLTNSDRWRIKQGAYAMAEYMKSEEDVTWKPGNT